MIDEATKKVARNQAMYRQVNEQIEDLNEAFSEMSGGFLVVCECGDAMCTEQITLSRQTYEKTRTNPAQFLVRPGHQVADVEEIITTEAEYMVVEKHEGTPAQLAEEADPRD
jgi:hypothetical protein